MSFYESLKPLIFKMSPECAHSAASMGLKVANNTPFVSEFFKKTFSFKDEILSQNLLGLYFENPVGLAGGFDKNGDLAYHLQALGFGFLEYGTFTPRAQDGNPKPRLWRLKEIKSIQNAMGFNNHGAAAVEKNIRPFYPLKAPVFANIGKNKLTPNENAINDYIYLASRFNELCDGFVINISSPNTPNLRALQNDEFLKNLASELKNVTNKPFILKLAPDMQNDAAISLCKKACELGFSAIILNNTSVDYSLYHGAKNTGGLSGEVIKEKSREFFKAVASELFGKITLISCGGISSADDALWRIKQGASLIEIYTALIFEGPALIRKINGELANLLRLEGFNNIKEAIGCEIKK